jgi:hypothetical protein
MRSRYRLVSRFGLGVAAAGVLFVSSLAAGSLAEISAAAAAHSPGTEQARAAPAAQAEKPRKDEKDKKRGEKAERPTAEQLRQRQEEASRRQQRFVASLATNLNVTPAQLAEAVKKARLALVAEGLRDGRLTPEQAGRLTERITAGQVSGLTAGFTWPKSAKAGAAAGGSEKSASAPALRGAGTQIAARAVGITVDQLKVELRSGKSLAQVAQERNIARDALKARLSAEEQAAINAAVARGELTAAEAPQVAARYQANLDRLVDRKSSPQPAKPAGSS